MHCQLVRLVAWQLFKLSAGICMLTVNTLNSKVIAGASPNYVRTQLSAACSKQSAGKDDNYSATQSNCSQLEECFSPVMWCQLVM